MLALAHFSNFLKMTALQVFKSKGALIPLLYIVLILISYQYVLRAIHRSSQSQSIKIVTVANTRVADTDADADRTANPFQGARFQRSIVQVRLRANSSEQNQQQHLNQNGTTRRSDSAEIRPDRQDGVKVKPHVARFRNGTVLYPWAGDPECEHYSVQFAPHKTFKPRALVSFPGSGNSWFRYLIEGATGYFTGSVFDDKHIYESGLLGEYQSPNDGTTIVQKTHHDAIYTPEGKKSKKLQAFVKLSELMFRYKGILLIRNPYDALRSYWNFHNTKDHKGVTKTPDLSTKGWSQFARFGSKKWASLIKDWVGNSMDLVIVMYEDLKRDPKEELIKILHYLEQSVDPKRIDCVVRHVEGPFHRTTTTRKPLEIVKKQKSSGNTLDRLVQGHIEQVNVFLAQNLLPLHLNYTGSIF